MKRQKYFLITYNYRCYVCGETWQETCYKKNPTMRCRKCNHRNVEINRVRQW